MVKKLKRSILRSWRREDAESLVRYANNRKIWRNLRDGFPHPYTRDHALDFLDKVAAQQTETYFAIELENEAVGSIGFALHTDVERVSAEIGYWLAEPFWNRGIMREALTFVTKYAIQTHKLTRVYATPYEWNQASFRVLERAGYQLEGRMRKSAVKDNQIVDQLLYACVVDKPGKI